MKEVEFRFRKKSGKSFSFIKEFRGDLLTPIGIFNTLKGNRKFIFESGTKGSNFARYSYIGCGDKMTELTSLEEVNEEISKMAEAYKMEADKLKELLGERELEQMKKDMAVQKAVTVIADAAKEV